MGEYRVRSASPGRARGAGPTERRGLRRMTDGSEVDSTEQQSGREADPVADTLVPADGTPPVPDELAVGICVGGEALVFGGLRLLCAATDLSREIARTVAHA